jgi:type IV pilus assembly protein PilN
MLVEINLLPKKDEKNIAIYVMAGIFLFLLIILFVCFSFYLNGKKEELNTLDKQVTMNQKILEIQQQKLKSYQSSNSVVKLGTVIKWAKDQPNNIVYVLQKLTSALPQRGFILEFELNGESKITQKVQFDTKTDAAYYLSSILKYPWITDAVINDVNQTDLKQLANNQNSTQDQTVTEGEIVPRYQAEYQIDLNIPLLKKASTKTDNKEEGGVTP